MIAGFAGHERPRRVLDIDGSATVEQTWEQIERIVRRTAEAIGLDRALADDEIVLLDEWHAGVYDIPDEKTIEEIVLYATSAASRRSPPTPARSDLGRPPRRWAPEIGSRSRGGAPE